MPYTKDYETIFPIPRDEETAAWLAAKGFELGTQWPIDNELLVWLVAESFDKAARAFGYELTEFTDEGEVDHEDYPEIGKELLERIGRPAEDFLWRRFTGKARQAAYVTEAIEQDGNA